jgi:hypothetical protein
MQDYLNSKKSAQKIIPNESCRELFITNHDSLRLGNAPILLQNLNMQKQMTQGLYLGMNQVPEFSFVLCDPLLGNSDYKNNLLMKPFQEYNKINVVYAPITSSVATNNITHLHNFLKMTKPKRIICSNKDHLLFQQVPGFDFAVEPQLIPGTKFEIKSNLSYYEGCLPESVANNIIMKNFGQMAIARLNVSIVLKDQKYTVVAVQNPASSDGLYGIPAEYASSLKENGYLLEGTKCCFDGYDIEILDGPRVATKTHRSLSKHERM